MDAPLVSSSTAISDAETTMNRGRRIQWPGGPAMAQNFSLPSSIIYYIAMNASNPKVYNKLIQTCKYFYERNPILVAATLTENTICSNDECRGHRECCVKMDINKIKSKIWLTLRLRLDQNNIPNFIALLRPKIYRCGIKKVYIRERKVEFEDLKFFALSAKDIFLDEAEILNNNGSPVMLENILEELLNVESFYCCFENNDSMVSASTLKNIIKLKNIGNLKYLSLWNIPEVLRLDDLFTFIKDHNRTKFRLDFADNISEHYKIQLDHLTDSLIESQFSNGLISYNGQNREKEYILWKLFIK